MPIEVPRINNSSTQVIEKPRWLRVKAPGSPEYLETKRIVKNRNLHTVCEEAQCPNIGECWSHSTATFMIMGDKCTRRCNFCSVKDGTTDNLEPLDEMEPFRVAAAIAELKLKHAVITSVDRDDLPDNGASHFHQTAIAIKARAPYCAIEFLIPDLRGNREDLGKILKSGINVLNHNIETVPRLYRKIRPGAGYVRSLSILRWAKEFDINIRTKSGIMVGLGETKSEVLSVLEDLRACNVDIVTIGQYLRPTAKQAPVKHFITPEEFKEYEIEGKKLGFLFVESGPFVRSSYHAWKHTSRE
jgi:lipoyl synthase